MRRAKALDAGPALSNGQALWAGLRVSDRARGKLCPLREAGWRTHGIWEREREEGTEAPGGLCWASVSPTASCPIRPGLVGMQRPTNQSGQKQSLRLWRFSAVGGCTADVKTGWRQSPPPPQLPCPHCARPGLAGLRGPSSWTLLGFLISNSAFNQVVWCWPRAMSVFGEGRRGEWAGDRLETTFLRWPQKTCAPHQLACCRVE